MPCMSNLETPLDVAVAPTRKNASASRARPGTLPFSKAATGGVPNGSRDSLAGLHPALVFVVVMVAGLAVIAALSIGLGFLVTRVLEPDLEASARLTST